MKDGFGYDNQSDKRRKDEIGREAVHLGTQAAEASGVVLYGLTGLAEMMM